MSDTKQSLQSKLEQLESEAKQSLQDKLAQLEKGLFLMSLDRVRALSAHETVDLIEELREVVTAAKTDLDQL